MGDTILFDKEEMEEFIKQEPEISKVFSPMVWSKRNLLIRYSKILSYIWETVAPKELRELARYV